MYCVYVIMNSLLIKYYFNVWLCKHYEGHWSGNMITRELITSVRLRSSCGQTLQVGPLMFWESKLARTWGGGVGLCVSPLRAARTPPCVSRVAVIGSRVLLPETGYTKGNLAHFQIQLPISHLSYFSWLSDIQQQRCEWYMWLEAGFRSTSKVSLRLKMV